MPRFIDGVHCLMLVACLSWQLPAQADSSLLILDNPQRLSFTGFASSLAAVGDMDGDGVVDYLVGAYEYRGGHSAKRGRAFVSAASPY
jgi:hypothetical protein